jgi:hypothetical protein
MISNEKYLNYKVVDIIKVYHFSYKNYIHWSSYEMIMIC